MLLPGCESSPCPSPKPTGRSIDIAGLLKTAAGRVSEGMYDMLSEVNVSLVALKITKNSDQD